MPELVECVPNVSEGRDPGVIRVLADAIESTPGARLLDVHSDADHHRSVFTFVAGPSVAHQAAFGLCRVARDVIDLRHHRGEHRRIGATDVIPFVPLTGVSMTDCNVLAARTAARIGRDLGIPTFLYGQAARSPDRAWLPFIRGAGFESLETRMRASLKPDEGPPLPHPSAGATAVGARRFLLAFNILLDTPDTGIASRIAADVRTAGGGLPGVQALGFTVGGFAQVSMNLFDLQSTGVVTAFDAIRARAEAEGVEIRKSEIVGLAPKTALPSGAGHRLQLEDADRVLDDHVGRYFPDVVLPLKL